MAQSLFDLNGQTALITGGARGIGKAIGHAFVQQGACVIVADIDGDEAARTAAELCDIQPGCRSLRLDVSDEAAAEAAVQEAIRAFGRIHILVNNAGVNTVQGRVSIEKFSTEDWRWIFSVDLDGVFFLSRPMAEHMKQRGGGRIINVSSVLGMVPARLQSAFVSAKAAVINLTKSMAIELAPHGILVNAVAPGSTLTQGTRKLFYAEDGSYSEKVQSLLSHIPLGRPGEAEEIAAVVVFLAAPASSYVTGTVLPVDGGWTAGYLRDW